MKNWIALSSVLCVSAAEQTARFLRGINLPRVDQLYPLLRRCSAIRTLGFALFFSFLSSISWVVGTDGPFRTPVDLLFLSSFQGSHSAPAMFRIPMVECPVGKVIPLPSSLDTCRVLSNTSPFLSHRCDRHNPGGEGWSWLPLVRLDQPTETQTYRRNEPSRCTHTCASAHAAGDVERRVRSRMETCNPWKVPRGRKRPPVVEEEDRDRDGHVCSPKATGSNTLAPRNVPKNVRSLRRPPVVRRCVCCPSVDWVKLG